MNVPLTKWSVGCCIKVVDKLSFIRFKILKKINLSNDWLLKISSTAVIPHLFLAFSALDGDRPF